MIAADGELARLLSQGLSGNGLVAVEWFRFNMFLYAIFVEFELNQRRFESGDMEKDLWDAWLEAYRWWLRFPGVRKWWSMEPAGFTAQFRKYIAREIDSMPVADGFSANVAAASNPEGPAESS
jgi:hypothetical protein